MNIATTTTPVSVTAPPSMDGSVLKDKIAIRNLDFYYGQNKALRMD